MGDLNFDLQNKNFRFSEFMEHTFSSKQIVSKVTRKYESLLDLAFLKVYPAKFYQVSDYRLSRASSFAVIFLYCQIDCTNFNEIWLVDHEEHHVNNCMHLMKICNWSRVMFIK
jgi:hypothetical protein